jgi:hypothetical protein
VKLGALCAGFISGGLLVTSCATAPPGVALPKPWQAPSAKDIRANYPENARRLRISGAVKLRCDTVMVDHFEGGLTNCRVIEESPAGYGFADSAVRLAGMYKAFPWTNNAASEPASIEILIQFRP